VTALAASVAQKAAGAMRYDSTLWRRLAWLGAAHGPTWWLRYSPPAFGLAAAGLVPRARRAVGQNLERVRGRVSPVRHALDVAETFTTYASCLAEGLSSGSKNDASPAVECRGAARIQAAVGEGRGLILVTAHTAGWELTGRALARQVGVPVTLVMEAERNAGARDLQDQARRAAGLDVVHVGGDPLESIALVHRLRDKGALAIQIDRLPPGMRGHDVRLFGRAGQIPAGPLRLAELTGAPILPVFSAREGFRRYVVETGPIVRLPRRAGPAARDAAAQQIADSMTWFLRAYPTQWLDFGAGEG
jgi:KDO2-lipid IV(A) lauroyltransferase